MEHAVLLAVRKTASEFAEGLFSENQMGWQEMRRNFVNEFVKDVQNNYSNEIGGTLCKNV